jgi:hypothetical protein
MMVSNTPIEQNIAKELAAWPQASMAHAISPFAMLNTVKRPPIRAQIFVRKWYKGVVLLEMTTIIGDI